jgi:hypothetical protein
MSDVEAAFAAGMAAAQREQDAMPGTGEVALDPGTPEQQPYIPPPMGGEDAGGVT